MFAFELLHKKNTEHKYYITCCTRQDNTRHTQIKNIEWDDTGYHNYYSVTPNENTNGKRVAKLYEILYFYFLTSMLIIPRVHSY